MSKEKNLPVTKEAAGLPAEMMDAFAADAGLGFEETSQQDYAIPFLSILQAMSPQCTIGKPQYNEDLRPGMFYNSVTEEAFSGKDGVLFIPAKYQRVGILWEPGKNDGTGFRGTLSAAELEVLLPQCSKDDKGHDITPDGFDLVDTRQWYGLLVKEDGTAEPVLMSLSSTQTKKSKRWLTLAQGLRHGNRPLPLSSQMYRLTTVPESNDKGSWMGLQVSHVGTVPSMELYEAAKAFKEMIDAGTAKPAMPEGGDTSFDTDSF